MVKTKELKPPSDVVDAIQHSEDGSTAPPDAEATRRIGATRDIGNKLTHEEPQKVSDVRQSDDHGNPIHGGRYQERKEKHLKFLEVQHEQDKEQQYDRTHPGAGKAGRGDQAINGMVGVDRFARKVERPHMAHKDHRRSG
eukprot:GHRR01001389.1.p1 GENE.GHRR01001389.1~~GHRR01001389.1.p1  ORF type:complete len:140 (+),score=36.96 GHRR01001389.1:350-769(+)